MKPETLLEKYLKTLTPGVSRVKFFAKKGDVAPNSHEYLYLGVFGPVVLTSSTGHLGVGGSASYIYHIALDLLYIDVHKAKPGVVYDGRDTDGIWVGLADGRIAPSCALSDRTQI